jgi:hypothetical protein
MHYYQIVNPGTKDWITHEDNQIAHIAQYGNDIWVTENTAWAARVGATELTKEQAQDVCNAEVTEARVAWEACRLENPDNEEICGSEPQYYSLP